MAILWYHFRDRSIYKLSEVCYNSNAVFPEVCRNLYMFHIVQCKFEYNGNNKRTI